MTDDSSTEDDDHLAETYSDESTYTITVNGSVYELNQDWRHSIEERALREYDKNEMFSCWWRVADSDDAADPDSVHNEGDPILVIETEGPMVPWSRLDQLEIEMQDTSSFNEFDPGSGADVDEGGGMRTVDPDSVKDDGSDESEEKSRTHFSVTPQDFQEVPSPDGEDPEKIPPKPEEFDDPSMVMWVPDNPEIEHSWGAGEAIAPMYSWVEWNVQQKAEQPRPISEKSDSHDHFESLAQMYNCEKVAERQPSQEPPTDTDSETGSDNDVARKFKEGTAGGNNWHV